MDLREIIGWLFEAMGVFMMLVPIPLFFFSLYVPRASQNPSAAVTGGIGFVIIWIPSLVIGGLIALFGYFLKRPRTITTQQTTQDITIRQPKQEIPSPPIQRVVVCPNCRGANHPENVFCRYCGHRLREE